MEFKIIKRLQAGWNAFLSRDPTQDYRIGPENSARPDRPRLNYGSEKSIVSAIYNRVAVDCSEILIKHVKLDDNDQFTQEIYSSLNNCLTLEANVDQTSKAFIQDIVISMFGEGTVALVPIDTTTNPLLSGSFDILTMRTGKIVGWFPKHVRVNVYNDNTGRRQEITLPKTSVAIIENPFYSIMNLPNSVLQRLIRKLNLLDVIDEQSGSGKLDIIMQLPYVIRTELRKKQAEERKKLLEDQLSGSKYGIGYIDGTEKITQLNRPSENNLMGQIEYLTNMLYSQLGITEEILAGTADEKTMLNYQNQVISPVMSSIADAIKRTFLTKTARTQKQSIMFFKDPFKFVTAENLAKLADSLTRNEIASSNDMRSVIGWKPRSGSAANELRNKNLNQATPPTSDNQPIKEPQ